MGGGGGTETETRSTLSPEQRGVAGELENYMTPRIGQGMEHYPGERFTPMSQDEVEYLEAFGELPEETEGLAGAGAEAFRSALQTDVPSAYGQQEMPVVDRYINEREEAARRQFEEEAVPEIEAQFQGPGTYWGGVRSEAVSEAREDFETDLEAQLAEARLNARQGRRQEVAQERAQQLKMGQQGLQTRASSLQNAQTAEAAQRQWEQKGKEVKFKKWLRQQPESSPVIKQALQFTGQPHAENIVKKGGGGGGAGMGSMIGTLAGGALGVALAPFTAGTSLAVGPAAGASIGAGLGGAAGGIAGSTM